MRKVLLLLQSMLLLALLGFSVPSWAQSEVQISDEQHAVKVMEQFHEEEVIAPERAISTKNKHEILFWMGSALLLLILLAASFGVAMGIFDKDVFVWHVLSAGLATTLAIAHAVVAFVWFYPE